MSQKRPIAARPPWRVVQPNGGKEPAKNTPENAVALEEFEREQMGLAAKE